MGTSGRKSAGSPYIEMARESPAPRVRRFCHAARWRSEVPENAGSFVIATFDELAGGAGVTGALVWARTDCETRQMPNSNGQTPTQREKRFFILAAAGARFITVPTRLQRASRNVCSCSRQSVASVLLLSASQTMFGIFSASKTASGSDEGGNSTRMTM